MKKVSPFLIVGIVLLGGIILGGTCAFLLVRSESKEDETKIDTITTSSKVIDESETSESGSKKLIFVHHSTGENWLADWDGGLGKSLSNEGYFVSDTNYGWGPDAIGDTTDIGHWWNWFRGPSSENYLNALYTESEQNSEYSRTVPDPGGENEIILFKSCFPNSNLLGTSSDPIPNINNNPLKGEIAESGYHTISNAKGIYIDLLEYFKTQNDKLFVIITAPPLGRNNTSLQAADNARAFNNWLVNDWLDDYDQINVVVFDLYNILTNDGESNYSEFSTDTSDDHPNTNGNVKATEEFIEFINEKYTNWKN